MSEDAGDPAERPTRCHPFRGGARPPRSWSTSRTGTPSPTSTSTPAPAPRASRRPWPPECSGPTYDSAERLTRIRETGSGFTGCQATWASGPRCLKEFTYGTSNERHRRQPAGEDPGGQALQLPGPRVSGGLSTSLLPSPPGLVSEAAARRS